MLGFPLLMEATTYSERLGRSRLCKAVWPLGIRVWGLGTRFRGQGLWVRVWGLRIRV